MGTHTLITGEIDQISLGSGFFDYTEKYNLITAKIHVPAPIPAETAARLKETAKKIYRVLGCSGFARVDMFLTGSREILFHEVNTIPGLHPPQPVSQHDGGRRYTPAGGDHPGH